MPLDRGPGVEPVDVGEDQQQIRLHQTGNLCREVIIIPKTDFFDHYRIVFIDDRGYPILQQSVECVVCV